MLTNKDNGQIYIISSENNGNMQVEVHKNLTSYNAFVKKPTQTNQPDRLNIYVGEKVKKLMETTLAQSEKTVAEVLQAIREQALQEQIAENVKSFPRTKWDVINFE